MAAIHVDSRHGKEQISSRANLGEARFETLHQEN
jgi:hypothetical protein